MLPQFLQPTSFVRHLTGSLRVAAAATPSKVQFTPRGIRPRFASASLYSSNMSLRHIPAKNLKVSTPTWWLESRFHFSFAEYYNPANTEFGVLRVLNDDLVKPHAGFGTHPHRDMEICTYIVDGKLTHKDSMGTAESLGRGSVQYMSAGTGVTHSEMNNDSELLRFLQIWIKPNARGLKPNYGSRVWKKEDRKNQLQHLVTDFKKLECSEDQHTGVIPIHQDVNMYASEADPGVSQTFTLQKKRQAYLVCIEGSLLVNQTNMSTRDAMEIRGNKDSEYQVELKADDTTGAHFFFIEMALN
ncbi:hypothetical protein R1flu_005903 [Riccia fluitans]|uniref:Pirin n=1 Tax=Riccia fluitans TaxID=41844 RepID=A0ABD1YVE9_9MARC